MEKKIKNRKILVIDDDNYTQNFSKQVLEGVGHRKIDFHKNGLDGWEAIQAEKNLGIIVLDWEIPELGGVDLFNRIRTLSNSRLVPVIVFSGFLSKEDTLLLEEYPCSFFLPKPYTKKAMVDGYTKILAEKKWYETNEESLLTIFRDLDSSMIEGVLERLKAKIKKSPNPTSFAALVSRQLRKNGMYEEAAGIISEFYAEYDSSVMIATEYAKVLLHLGRFEECQKVLDSSFKICPDSVRRLCLSGESHLAAGNTEKAKERFEDAKKIGDGFECPRVESGTLVADNLDDYLEQEDHQSVFNNLASMLNILGVNLIKKGKFEEGIRQYEAAFPLVDSYDEARLKFNQGLAFLKDGQKSNAVAAFEQSVEISGGRFNRGAEILNKLSKGGQQSGEAQNSDGGEDEDEMSIASGLDTMRPKAQQQSSRAQEIEMDFDLNGPDDDLPYSD